MQNGEREGVIKSVKKILIVDDEKMIQQVFSDFFNHAGYEVTVASNGVECGLQLFEHEFDVILMDMMMPEMSGDKAIRYIKNSFSEKIRSMKIIIISSFINDEIREEFGQYKNIYFFEKPVKLLEVMKVIEER
ncbi:MAG: response regulator [Oligoflexia bacterium]|nr:response regulator [Oligoflexia bacterium]